jgi:pimeloyl-ACP methyl ester carboxylesterase
MPALRRYGEVLAVDHPGFGRSEDFADGRQSLERSALFVSRLLDVVGWDGPVDIVGHSHGGLVAIALAALAPERVASIVALGSGGTPAHPAYRALAALPRLAQVLPVIASAFFRRKALRPLARPFVRQGSRQPFAPAPPPAWVVDEQLNDLAERPEVLGTMVRVTLDDPCRKVVDYARRLKARTLFIHGAHDALVNVQYARRLFDAVGAASGARFVELDGGHMVHVTHPERVSPVLNEWFGSVRQRS